MAAGCCPKASGNAPSLVGAYVGIAMPNRSRNFPSAWGGMVRSTGNSGLSENPYFEKEKEGKA